MKIYSSPGQDADSVEDPEASRPPLRGRTSDLERDLVPLLEHDPHEPQLPQ